MLHVHYVIADCEIAEIGEKGGAARFRPRRRQRHSFRFVEQVERAEQRQIALRQNEALRHEAFQQNRGSSIAFAQILRRFVGKSLAAAGGAAADAVWQAVLGEHFGHALHFAKAGQHANRAVAGGSELADLFRHSRHAAVESPSRLRLESDVFAASGGEPKLL